ncbi:hypothetical protein QUB16_11145 [Microcoleus sp. D3_18a_C4]
MQLHSELVVLCIAILAEGQYLKIISLNEYLKKRSRRNSQLCSQDNAEPDAIDRVEYKNLLSRSAKQIALLVCHIRESRNAAIEPHPPPPALSKHPNPSPSPFFSFGHRL